MNAIPLRGDGPGRGLEGETVEIEHPGGAAPTSVEITYPNIQLGDQLLCTPVDGGIGSFLAYGHIQSGTPNEAFVSVWGPGGLSAGTYKVRVSVIRTVTAAA